MAETLADYPGFGADLMPTLIDSATALGITRFDNLDLRYSWATVEGRDARGRQVHLAYAEGSVPVLEEPPGRDLQGPYLSAAQLRGIDVADVLRRTRRRTKVDLTDTYLLIDGDDGGRIKVYPGNGYLAWDLTGTRVLVDYTED